MECGSEWVDMNADSEEEVEFDYDEDLLERNETSDMGLFSTSSVAPPPPPPQQATAARLKKRKVRKANTNVISVKLGTLTQDVAIATGDPVFCIKCQAALSAIDVAKMTESKEKDKDARIWRCCFCGTENEINLDDEELPREESIDYILEPPSEAVSRGSSSSEKQLIFCIDISGSMCVTTEIEGKHELKGAEARKRLASLNTERADQWAPRERRDITYVSRLQSVQAAVDAQLAQMEKEQPSRRVGLVTFNSEVTVLGDGTSLPVTITGDKLNDYDQLLQAGRNLTVSQPICKTKSALSTKLFGLEETGPTALGPALLVCSAIASQSPGSEIVVCTDGLSNVGLGQLDDTSPQAKSQTERFYERVGDFAVQHGVTISIIGIKGEDCRMEQLGALAEKTNGIVNIVDPLRITQEFSSILSQPIIATNVGVKLILHKGLFIRDDEVEDERSKDSFVNRDVGNVTSESSFTFEFGVRPAEEAKALGVDVDLPALPFQLQIRYTKLDGMKCIRIISKEQKATRDREQAEMAANVDVLGLNAVQKSARIAQKGEYTFARLENFTHTKLMKKVALGSEEKTKKFSLWGAKQKVLEKELKEVKRREQDDGLNLSDSDNDEDAEAMEEEKKSAVRKAKKQAKEQARKDRRDDQTANVLWSLRSKRK